MKRFGITGKLVFSSVCIFFGLGLAVTWYSVSQLRSMLYQEMVRRVEAQALNWIEANTSQIVALREQATLERLVNELRARQNFAYVILWDGERRTPLASSGVPPHLALHKEATPVQGIKSRLQSMKDGARRRYYEVATPISASGTGMNTDLESMFELTAGPQALAVVRIGVLEQELDRRLGVLVPQNVLLFGALVLFALAINIWLANRMVTPITSIGRAATRIAGGSLSERVKEGVDLQDEVGELVRNFNQMAKRLEENREEMNLLYTGLEQKVHERTAELEQANRRLQELDQLKSQVISIVSHELRSPLTSIKAFSQILLDSNPDPEARKRFLEIIDKESDRLSRLISDMLDLARIESGTVSWRMEQLDLKEIVADALPSLSSLAAENSIKLELADSAPQAVLADADKIRQVITNLVGNAIKFSPKSGIIKIRLERIAGSGPGKATSGCYVRVAVEDSGPGIPREEQALVFERFYRGVRDRAAHSGAGLGLTISREIVAHHGGEIWVESEPECGSTFYFTLPARKQ